VGRDPLSVDIRRLGPGDEDGVRAAGALFDDEPRGDATRGFLAEPSHHLLVAYDPADAPAGFVTGIETTHPDKGTEMFLYELAVAETMRRRGVGRALVDALAAVARARRCYAMWVLADRENEPALRTYAAAGGREASRPVMLEWDLAGPGAPA
jgi:ribosomal protein S18 acetylase RimI-like enzyme